MVTSHRRNKASGWSWLSHSIDSNNLAMGTGTKNNGLFKGELKWDLTKKNKVSNNPNKLEVTNGFKILYLQALFPWMPKDFYISLAQGDNSRKCSSNDFMASRLQVWRWSGLSPYSTLQLWSSNQYLGFQIWDILSLHLLPENRSTSGINKCFLHPHPINKIIHLKQTAKSICNLNYRQRVNILRASETWKIKHQQPYQEKGNLKAFGLWQKIAYVP